MKKLTLLIALLFSSFIWPGNASEAYAQHPLLDSLLTELAKQKNDSNKVSLLNEISFAFTSTNPDEGLSYGNQALTLSENLNWKKGIAASYRSIGLNYWSKSDYFKALEYHRKALKINEEIGNKSAEARNYANIGIVYIRTSDYPKALENLLKSLKIYESLKDSIGMRISCVNIGNVHGMTSNYPKALEYFMKALKYGEESGDKRTGEVYGSIGSIYGMASNYPKALEYLMKSLKYGEKSGDKSTISIALANIGFQYGKIGKYALALEYNFKALRISKEIASPYGIAQVYYNIGSFYYKIGTGEDRELLGKLFSGNKMAALNQSKLYCDSARVIYLKINELDQLSNLYKQLSDISIEMGDDKGALENYKNYTLYKDSVFNMEKDKKLTQAAMQYEFDKKEATTKAEQEKKDIIQQNVRNSIATVLLGALVFSGVVFRQRNKISKEKKRSEDLLLNILPEEVAEELKAKGEAEAKLLEEVTVLFTDFKGFTTMSEKLSPKDLVKDIHECFSAFDHIMQKHGMEKIKTIGDSYMAAGGLPTPNKTHALDAVKAAQEIIAFIEEGKARKISANQPYFDIRIGIHTGPVVAGIVGIKKFQYDIWGDTVNTASRMESSGEVGKINISESTYTLVKDNFTCEYRGEIDAKGKGEMKMYFVN